MRVTIVGAPFAIERSWSALSPSEQRVLAGLARANDATQAALVIDAASTRFRLGRTVVDLAAAPLLFRLLAALARAHAADRHGWAAAAELIAQGWPGEVIRPDAARNRLRVALTRLRRTGLGAHLEHHASRYRLAPALVVSGGAVDAT